MQWYSWLIIIKTAEHSGQIKRSRGVLFVFLHQKPATTSKDFFFGRLFSVFGIYNVRNCWSWHWTHIAYKSTSFTYQQIEGQDGVVKDGFEQEAGVIIFGFIPQTVQFLVFTPVRRKQLWLLITTFGLMVYVREMRRAEETGLNKLYKLFLKNEKSHSIFPLIGSTWHNFLLTLHMPLLQPCWNTAEPHLAWQITCAMTFNFISH